MRNNRRIGWACATTLGCVMMVSVPVVASTDSDVVVLTGTVRYGDLNFTSEADIASLYRRIGRMAENVCGSPERLGSRRPSRDWKDCVSRSVREAVDQVHREPLTAYYRSHASRGH